MRLTERGGQDEAGAATEASFAFGAIRLQG